MSTSYHHGNLPTVLREHAAALLAEQGLATFSLREVARRAGVSHAAPAHHFGSVGGLLTAVAAEGFRLLVAACTDALDAAGPDPDARFSAIGHAYVALWRTNPGHCQVMFRYDVVDYHDDDLHHWSDEAYALLATTTRAVVGEIDDRAAHRSALLWWSTVNGLTPLETSFATVSTEVAGQPEPATTDELVEEFAAMVLHGIERGRSRQRRDP
ncbi:MAG: TetR/AcrR family transcriptional regulator [Actinomycetes bacterium]